MSGYMKNNWLVLLVGLAPALQGVTFVGNGEVDIGDLNMIFNEDNTQISNDGPQDFIEFSGREFLDVSRSAISQGVNRRFGIEITTDLQADPNLLGPLTATATLGRRGGNPDGPFPPLFFREIERNVAGPGFTQDRYTVNITVSALTAQWAYDQAPVDSDGGSFTSTTTGTSTINLQGSYTIAGPVTTTTGAFDVTGVNNFMDDEIFLQLDEIMFPDSFELPNFFGDVFNIDEPTEIFDVTVDGQRFNHFFENSFLAFSGEEEGGAPILLTAVPEPSSVFLLSGALLCLMNRRKR